MSTSWWCTLYHVTRRKWSSKHVLLQLSEGFPQSKGCKTSSNMMVEKSSGFKHILGQSNGLRKISGIQWCKNCVKTCISHLTKTALKPEMQYAHSPNVCVIEGVLTKWCFSGDTFSTGGLYGHVKGFPVTKGWWTACKWRNISNQSLSIE